MLAHCTVRWLLHETTSNHHPHHTEQSFVKHQHLMHRNYPSPGLLKRRNSPYASLNRKAPRRVPIDTSRPPPSSKPLRGGENILKRTELRPGPFSRLE